MQQVKLFGATNHLQFLSTFVEVDMAVADYFVQCGKAVWMKKGEHASLVGDRAYTAQDVMALLTNTVPR